MVYDVSVTKHAELQLKQYIDYTVKKLKNRQAARAIREDAKKTIKKLSFVADSLALCPNETLARNGYRRIMFDKHDFFMVYLIKDECVIVEAMYHCRQDYEALFAHRKGLV